MKRRRGRLKMATEERIEGTDEQKGGGDQNGAKRRRGSDRRKKVEKIKGDFSPMRKVFISSRPKKKKKAGKRVVWRRPRTHQKTTMTHNLYGWRKEEWKKGHAPEGGSGPLRHGAF